MVDKLSFEGEKRFDEENLNELRFSRAQSYFDRSIVIRIFIGVIFAFFLFFFLHFREAFIESIELGSEAKHYVVAQMDFIFPDEEATIIARQEAGREIGKIYQIDKKQIQERIAYFQKYLHEGGESFDESINLESSFEDFHLALSFMGKGLEEIYFTDFKTFQKIEELRLKDLPLPKGTFFAYIPPLENLTGKLPSPFWNIFTKKILLEKNIPTPVITVIIDHFQPLIWEFFEDQSTEYALKRLMQEQVPEKLTFIEAGERLINQGEKITARHIAMLQAMKEKMSERRNLFNPLTISGTLLMTLLLLGVSIIYLRENHKDVFLSNRKLSLLVTVVLFAFLLAKLSEFFLMKKETDFIDLVHFPLFVPFAAILLSSLLNARIATFATLFLSVVFSIALPVESNSFLIINILTSMVVILSARTLKRRKEVFVICAKAWLVSFCVVLAFFLYDNTMWTFHFFNDIVSTLIFMVLTAILVVGLLPFFESVFRIMTDITLMEFLDPSNELLRQLTIKVPGTYQHSIVVGNLAESGASAIGANGLFCRVATQYHDIGKLANPQYFTENQLGGMDMHQLLTPLESAQVIIAHVSEGVALARKVGLPEQFIDIIKEHHGTTLVYYFYHKYLEQLNGDKSQVNEKDFRYSGPKPRSKESTIIMIADAFEAASRSLSTFNEKTITELLDRLVAQKAEDNQFDDSLLTFQELGIVKHALIKTLLAASHGRVKYPAHHPGEEG